MDKIIVFDIWADYAHIKKPYTTTSPITYSIPTRTVITGILGAILGIPKNKNNVILNSDDCSISLRIINPIKKVMVAQNLIDTKTAKYYARMKQRTQIRFEYLKESKYRIYVMLKNDELYRELRDKLVGHESYYTISVGLSENLANFDYIGEYDYELIRQETEIDSVISLDKVNEEDIVFEGDKEYFTERIAIDMLEDREVTKYSDVLFERNGKKIKVRDIECYELENQERVVFM
ncbi:type I-B CRISPR-associated protein Cas5b [Vallitalea guaymasensis]|uniref:type I-B CRISPR-associated protein Cas5b n=1 Tax=Vallitalea guaymasensis TaxID=1185412 RepID=UPI0023543BE3|nr:type I-B CRISPR-associated protein Cas5b [Vallitalea guaymasensis]